MHKWHVLRDPTKFEALAFILHSSDPHFDH
jgi:hypothetical protein